MRKIAKEEVEALFKFVKSKYVHHFDVQCELVDHLACAIEEEWETSPDISFEAALSAVYSRFPVTGFTRFVEQQATYVRKYWTKMLLNSYKSFFTSPMVFSILVFYYVFDWLTMLTFGKWAVFAIITSFAFVNNYSLKKLQNKYPINDKNFGLLITNTVYSFYGQFLVNAPILLNFDLFNIIQVKFLYTAYITHLFVVNQYLTPEVENKLALYAKKLNFN